MTSVKQPRVGVGLLVRRGDDILVIRRRGSHGSGTWSVPGGYLEPGEHPADCAVREAREETGVEVGATRFVGVTNDVFREQGRHSVTLWFEADHASGGDRPEPREVSELAWRRPDALPVPLFEPLHRLLSGEVV